MAVDMKTTILATSDYYLPGHRGGGAVQAISNMVVRLSDDWDFKVITRDRDLGDKVPYANLTSEGRLFAMGDILYLAPRNRWLRLIGLFRKIEFSIQYHNSFFSPAFTFPLLLARKLSLIPKRPLIIAPRGEFSLEALRLKSVKKRIYILLLKYFGLCDDARWHVSTEAEAVDVRKQMGKSALVTVARDCLPLLEFPIISTRAEKIAGQLSVVFLSRICRIKNLAYALSALANLSGRVQFDIYGPKEDMAYWRECDAVIQDLPENIVVRYRGEVVHDEVVNILGRYHLFFLPTFGESFGFVILEALLAGCPVLISDRTPWQELGEHGAGWSIPLEAPRQFRTVLQSCLDMDSVAFSRRSEQARALGIRYVQEDISVAQTRSLLSATIELLPPSARQIN